MEEKKNAYTLHCQTGHIETGYCYEEGVAYISILEGRMRAKGEIYTSGQVVEFACGERIAFVVLEELDAVLVVYGNESKRKCPLDKPADYLPLFRDLYRFPFFQDFPFSEISVVVQGAVDKEITPLCLESVRRFLPGSRIILSTWEGTETDSLDYDLLLLNKDPGGIAYSKCFGEELEQPNNVNRQLLSTQEGLKKADTRYALKLRSDMVLLGNVFLQVFEQFPACTDAYRIFQHKVLVSELFTRHHLATVLVNGRAMDIPTPFHVSDWFQFGYTEDLQAYFLQIEPMSREDGGLYQDVKFPKRKLASGFVWNHRFPPEEYYAVQALAQHGFPAQMEDWSDWNHANQLASLQFIMNNFISLDFVHSGILLPKYGETMLACLGETPYLVPWLYTFHLYQEIYDQVFAQNIAGDGIWEDLLEGIKEIV